MSEKDGPRFFELNHGITYLGRSAINDVQIKDHYVSREHLLLRKVGDKILIRDLGSKNGTFVNGNQIHSGTEFEVKEGASIVIGMSVICLGEKGSDEVLALMDSVSASKGQGATATLVSRKAELRPVTHKQNNVGSSLTLRTWHASNAQFSESN
ncbi:MAG: FHA domain-containing protein [Desulfobacteraceae bacterium]|jgi:pSer/pThr/pTyr-binding forkhead associated (FHA) protein